MGRTFGVLAVVVSAASTPLATIGAQRQPKQYTIEQFLNTTSISGLKSGSAETR